MGQLPLVAARCEVPAIRRAARCLFALAMAWTLTGCASLGTYNPATGRKEFIFVPTDYEVSMGQEIHRQVTGQYKLSDRKADADRLTRIGQKVAQVSDRQDYAYHFYLIESKELNAFTTPGGSIYMFTGLYDQLKVDDAIAGVLAHEVGHCAARHTVKKFQAALGYDLISGIIIGQVSKEQQVQQIAGMGANAVMGVIFSSYSRQDEYEADRLGLKYLDLSGYDMNGMLTTFEVLKKGSNGKEGPLILRSHPYIDDRITAVKQEMARIKAEGTD